MLPITNDSGYYEIRLESIGGLGANLACKILGEIGAIYLGLNSAGFSSYGSEKRGSPVKGFIRYASGDREIRINSPIEKPHLLALFHQGLMGKIPVMAGVTKNTSVVINTPLSPEETRKFLKMHAGKLFCIDALAIAQESKSRVNMVMLGAIAKATGFISLETLEKAIDELLGKKYPAALQGNLSGIRRGYEVANAVEIEQEEGYPYIEYVEPKQPWGYDNAPIGGVNPIFGSTISNDLSASREGVIPVFKKESCIQCGLCDSTCPDMVYQFVQGEYKGKPSMVNLGPDYHHCKGCLRCVEVCPTDAITEGKEREHDISKTHVRNQALIVEKLEFEEVGPNSYMESESITNSLK